MPINKIRSSNRAKLAIAAVLSISSSVGGVLMATRPGEQAVPAAVRLAVDAEIMPWEGLVLTSHWDRFSKRWDICHGDTLINGKPVTAGMKFTKAECYQILLTRVTNDYYKPLTRCIADFDKKPIGLQAMLISGAYNFGVNGTAKHPGACQSTAARLTREGRYAEACVAMTAFNKAGVGTERRVVQGLVNRREMGDRQRIGEAELCVSGLQ
ncbi:glycoside hydrolase family protein [Mesorhizobium sp. B2-1-2]|uniref:glycoside hydrolase family protein n=1 Tax=Mesorhizobium sp. B2-1-2 TaxID=2589973 RepID=UPI00112AA959|nr:glycoside hydrolase family protein [Mesorhizobium sp. B2-1-2]TPN04529.1 lysozyme [Mesorhizobium sp. B2-1-2]